MFEFGYSYLKKEEGFQEDAHLTLFVTGQNQSESWLNKNKAASSYYSLKAVVDNLMNRLGVGKFQQTVLNSNEETTSQSLTYGLRYHRGAQVLVEFGKVRSNLLKKMDIKQEVFYADVNWDSVIKALKKHQIKFEELTKYPTVRRDLALVIDLSLIHISEPTRPDRISYAVFC